jgi:hypothetical protein
MTKSDPEETYSEEETVARREAALKRAFATPHKPHKPKDGNTHEKPSK